MRAIAVAALLALAGCAAHRPRPAPDYGSGGSMTSLPPLQLEVFRGLAIGGLQTGGSANCASASAACLAASFTSTGTGSFSTLTTTGPVISGGVGIATLGARHSAGFSALWFNVTPTATNYGIGGDASGNTDINTAGNLGFNVGNSNRTTMTNTKWTSSIPWESTAASGSNVITSTVVGARTDFGPGTTDYGESNGTDTVTFAGALGATSTKTRGTITLSGGTGTATVNSGAICSCTDTTANASVQCTVATTTLTATGTGTDVIAYICL